MTIDRAEMAEKCKLAQFVGGPQLLSAVGIGGYLRVCSPEAILALLAENEAQRDQLLLAKQAPLYSTRRDAERYRWLRDIHIGDDPEAINLDSADKPGLNKAIDAAMSKAATS